MQVAALAERVGVSPHTVRYYERVGLIAAPPRTAGGYRDYSPGEVDRLGFIQGCQRFGLRLRDIKALLDVRDTGECPCEPAADLIDRRLAEVDAELARLSRLRGEIAAIAGRFEPGPGCCPAPVPGTWTSEEVSEDVD